MLKKFKGLFITTAILITLAGCGKSNVTNCNVLSVENNKYGTSYICANSISTYMYENNAIYDTTSNKKITDVEELVCMAATDNKIYYFLPDEGGCLYSLSLDTQKTSLVSKEYYVAGMKAHANDVFVVIRAKDDVSGKAEDYSYDLLKIGANEKVENLTEWAAAQEPVKSNECYATYEYDGYRLTADLSLASDKIQLAYIESDDFEYSCLPYNVYAKIGDEIVCEDKYPEELAKTDDGEGGISPFMTEVYDGCFYSLVQYSKGTWAYQENPSIDFKVRDTYYKYDPQKDEYSLLYKADKNEQIAGFSAENNIIYLLRKNGVYERDLKTEQEILLIEDPLSNEKYGTLYFENFNGELYIFSEKFASHTPTLLYKK